MTGTLKYKIETFLKGWGYSFLIALIIATSFKSVIADWNVVPTGSMKPTILEGDRIFVNKLAYDLKVPYTTWHLAQWDDPQRGDIVVFYSPEDGKRLVKRVVGVPDDTVALMNNQLIINGEKVNYDPVGHETNTKPPSVWESDQYHFMEDLDGARHPIMITPHRPAMRSFGPVTVPEGCYWMLGDNRDNSADSRYFGFVERSRIVGRATTIVVSLDINNNYRPRWQRFFNQLP